MYLNRFVAVHDKMCFKNNTYHVRGSTYYLYIIPLHDEQNHIFDIFNGMGEVWKFFGRSANKKGVVKNTYEGRNQC